MKYLKSILSFFLRASRIIRNVFKRAILYPFGLRAARSTEISWNVSVDGGGGEGRILLGERTSIAIGVVLEAYGGIIAIGDDCSVNPYCVLNGAGGIRVGDGVRIAAHTVIISSNHVFSDPNIPIRFQGESKIGIQIEDDVWIGAGARILDGVRVATGTVIAAGAVVTKSTEPFSIVAGVPAKKIASRHTFQNTD